MDEHKIKSTPYWYIALLQTINTDCLSYVIRVLDKHYRETLSLASLCSLVVAIRRYVKAIEYIDPHTLVPTERNMLAEYREFLLSLKQIVANVQDLLSKQDAKAALSPELYDKIHNLLQDVARKKDLSKEKERRTVTQESVPPKIANRFGLPSERKPAEKEVEFSFRDSSPSTVRSLRKEEEEKHREEEKDEKKLEDMSESESSDDGFVRKQPRSQPLISKKVDEVPAQKEVQSFPIGIPRKF